jgi:hypothetical protein
MALIEKNHGSYFEVREPLGGCTRFESLTLRDAETFATDVYRSENLVCEIHQHSRSS